MLFSYWNLGTLEEAYHEAGAAIFFRLTKVSSASTPIAARLAPAGSGVASVMVSVIVPVLFEIYSKPPAVSNEPPALTAELPRVVGGPKALLATT